eukprot:gene8168-32320_t
MLKEREHPEQASNNARALEECFFGSGEETTTTTTTTTTVTITSSKNNNTTTNSNNNDIILFTCFGRPIMVIQFILVVLLNAGRVGAGERVHRGDVRGRSVEDARFRDDRMGERSESSKKKQPQQWEWDGLTQDDEDHDDSGKYPTTPRMVFNCKTQYHLYQEGPIGRGYQKEMYLAQLDESGALFGLKRSVKPPLPEYAWELNQNLDARFWEAAQQENRMIKEIGQWDNFHIMKVLGQCLKH